MKKIALVLAACVFSPPAARAAFKEAIEKNSAEFRDTLNKEIGS